MRFIKNVDRAAAGKDLGAEGVFGTKADEEYQILGIADVVFEVMENSACFAHARCADDNGGFVEVVELHRMRHLADVGEVFHAERIGLFTEVSVDVVVEAFRVQPVDFGGINAQRAIDKDGNFGQLAGIGELMEFIDDLLSAPNRESGNDDKTVPVDCFTDKPADFLACAGTGSVQTAAVSAFDLEEIDVMHSDRVAQNLVVAPPDIAAEQISESAIAFLDVEDDLRGAKDVPCVMERGCHPLHYWESPVVVESDELLECFVGVLDRVKRFDWRKPLFCAFFGNELRVSGLDMR